MYIYVYIHMYVTIYLNILFFNLYTYFLWEIWCRWAIIELSHSTSKVLSRGAGWQWSSGDVRRWTGGGFRWKLVFRWKP